MWQVQRMCLIWPHISKGSAAAAMILSAQPSVCYGAAFRRGARAEGAFGLLGLRDLAQVPEPAMPSLSPGNPCDLLICR